MRTRSYADAIEDALTQAMSEDSSVIILGEDVQLLRVNLLARFGEKRVINTPISEAAFLGAGVTAAMAGLKPIVEIMLVDFIGVAMDALLNHAAKTAFFSGGRWSVPMVVRASCGGGYGDGGQHEQTLWGWLGHIPGLCVVVPSTPADAYGLMIAAIEYDGPVIFLEHKLLSDYWRDYLGSGGRKNQDYNVPADGASGSTSKRWSSIPVGQAEVKRTGSDISVVSVEVGVHRALEAAHMLESEGISTEVIDLRTISPLDRAAIIRSVGKTGRLIVVDEDYMQFGLSGEVAAVLLEEDIKFTYRRVCQEDTIPYSHQLEIDSIPNVRRIIAAVHELID